jgi:hypothetical protein
MPFRKPSVILFIVLALFTVFSLISAQSDIPLPLPSEPDGGSAQFQDRSSIELLTNGSFEVDLDGDKLPDGWKAKNTNVAKSDKLKCNKPDKIVAYNGNCAFQFSGNPTGEESKLSQDIPAIESIVNGGTLTLSAYLDPKSGVAGSKIASLKVKLSDSSKLKLDLRLPSDASTSDYTQLTDTLLIAIPTGVFITEAKLDLKYGETSGKYLIDDVRLTMSVADLTATPVTPTGISPTKTVIFTSTATSISTSPVEATATHTATSTNTPTDTPTNTATLTNTATDTPSPTPTSTMSIQQIVADDGEASDVFGNSVSLSADGNMALIGAYQDSVSENIPQGSAYIYVRDGNSWIQQTKLIAADGIAFDFFGYSVNLSADGNTALVGAHWADVGGNSNRGAAYVYVRDSGNTWIQQAKLVATDGAVNDWFGYSVNLSADGNTALIGAHRDDVNTKTDQGSAYVYVRNGSIWTQQVKIVAMDGAVNDWFGDSVSLSADGNTALIGAYGDDVGSNSGQGSAYVYVRNGGAWSQQSKLMATDGTLEDYFGYSVTLSADGNTALVGAYTDDINGNSNQGSAYVYVRNGTIWTQQVKLAIEAGGISDYFGSSAALSANGNTALIGAAGEDIGENSNQGAAYLYVRDGSIWIQQTKLMATDGGSNDAFGNSIKLSWDGTIALIGAGGDTIDEKYGQGSAWVFSNISNLPVPSPTPTLNTSQVPLTTTLYITETPIPTFTSTATPTSTPTRTPTSTLPPGVTVTNTPFVMATQPPSGGGE